MTGAPRAAVTVAACLAAGVALAWRVLTFTGFSNDHYVHLARAQQMLLGDWPVRDFVDPGMPLMYAVSAIARFAAGPALGTELLVVAGAIAIGAAVSVVAARRLSGSVTIALAVTLVQVAINPRSFGYPKIVLYAVAAWATLEYAAAPTSRRILQLAALVAVAFLFRHDHGLYIGIGAAAAVVLASLDAGPRVVGSRLGALAGAVAIILLPWALYVAAYQGLVDYFQSGLEFSRREAESTMLRALPAFDASRGLQDAVNAQAWLFYLFHLLPFACLALAWWRHRTGGERWRGEAAGVAAVALMAIPANAGFLRDTLVARIPDAVVPASLLGAWLMGLAVRARAWRAAALAAMVCVFAATAAAVWRVADVREQLDRAGVVGRHGAMRDRIADLAARLPKPLPERDHVPSRYAAALMPFFEYLQRCTSPDDRLMMTGLFPDVYVLAGRGFAGGHMAYMGGFYSSPAEQARALERLREESVPFVVLVLELEEQFRTSMPRIAGFVDGHYDALSEIPVPETPGLRLYRERRRKPSGVDAATVWPCFSSGGP